VIQIEHSGGGKEREKVKGDKDEVGRKRVSISLSTGY
jgi:hypothetical protein